MCIVVQDFFDVPTDYRLDYVTTKTGSAEDFSILSGCDVVDNGRCVRISNISETDMVVLALSIKKDAMLHYVHRTDARRYAYVGVTETNIATNLGDGLLANKGDIVMTEMIKVPGQGTQGYRMVRLS